LNLNLEKTLSHSNTKPIIYQNPRQYVVNLIIENNLTHEFNYVFIKVFFVYLTYFYSYKMSFMFSFY